MNIKQKCAKEALKYIRNGMTIGLGGGSTIGYLAQYVKEADLDVKVVTPSFDTEKICVDLGLPILPLHHVSHVDIAFDGCDEADRHLYALKSGGGIHTKEKLIANMADDYMLLIDESKFFEKLPYRVPIVIELLDDALAYVQNRIEALHGRFVLKHADGKFGAVRSDYGNVLADVYFDEVTDSKELNDMIKCIPGVIDTSIVTEEITKILVAKEEEFLLIEK